ncbi:MAG: lysostaphin resistance A-like protein [Limisphaerales bacterium]
MAELTRDPEIKGCAAAAEKPPAAATAVRHWGMLPTFGLSAVVAVSFVGMQLFVALIWGFAEAFAHGGKLPHGWESSGLLLAIATCVSAPVAFGFTLLFAHLRKSASAAQYLGFRKVPLKSMVFWTLALLGLVAASDLLTVRLGKPVVPEFMQNAYRTAGFVPLLWLALLIAAPVTEETLFRGFLFVGILNSRLGPLGAILITSLIWALIHVQYDAYGVFTVFVTGLLLGLVRLATGSLYATVFLHFLMNLIATVETICILGTFA